MAEADNPEHAPFPHEALLQPPVPQAIEPEPEAGWWSRNRTRLVLGAAAVSTVTTIATSPMGETKDSVLDAAPWVGGALLAGEVGWCTGAAMMIPAVGDQIGLNPLKLRERMTGIAQKANNSRLFMAGFALNLGSAVAQASVMTAGIVKELPPQSWGWLAVPAVDLWVTLAARRIIYDGITHNQPVIQDAAPEA